MTGSDEVPVAAIGLVRLGTLEGLGRGRIEGALCIGAEETDPAMADLARCISLWAWVAEVAVDRQRQQVGVIDLLKQKGRDAAVQATSGFNHHRPGIGPNDLHMNRPDPHAERRGCLAGVIGQRLQVRSLGI